MAAEASPARRRLRRRPAGRASGRSGSIPLALMAAIVVVFAVLGAPGLGERRGPPAEDLVVDKIVLHPGVIELKVRNDGPDAVAVKQVIVNDGYVNFTSKYDSDQQAGGRHDQDRLPVDRGRGVRDSAADLDRRGDRRGDPGRGRDARRRAPASTG